MSDEADLLAQVVAALETMDIPYMIGGSMALAVWAQPRMTHDIDIVVDLPGERVAEFCRYFPADRFFLDPGAMRAAFGGRNTPSLGMYSFVDMHTGLKVDLFPLRRNDPAQQTALARRVAVEVLEGRQASVYTPTDLLIQKLRWYAMGESERQLRDCLNLVLSDLRRTPPQIDWAEVDGWAQQLGPVVARAWQTVRAAAEAARDSAS
ncbi:MAG: hypothetical protein M3Z04_05745 [Chloroflexota bacterium]|nr:hypothetical protein [Chloroflexota bacterium]